MLSADKSKLEGLTVDKDGLVARVASLETQVTDLRVAKGSAQ